MTILLLGLLFMVLMFVGMPVAFAMGVPGIAYLFMIESGMNLSFLPHSLAGPLFNYVLIAVPAFLLMGRMLNASGVTDRLFDFAIALVGRFKGGLAYSNVLCSMFFASMSGTAVGDAGGLGVIEMEMMDKAGYRKAYSAGITAASSVLGPLIPPSVTMVLVGASAQLSVGKLFMGGIIPGVLMTLALLAQVFIMAKFTKEGKSWPLTRMGLRESLTSTVKAIPALMTPVIIIGGILWGVVTPTEAAVVAIDYALLLGILYRKINLKVIIKTLMDTVEASGTFLIITSCAGFFTWMVTIEGLPQLVAEILSPVANSSQIVCVLILSVFFLVIGCFMDTSAAVILLTPTLMPIIVNMGIDPIYFGVVMTVALVTGIITPPFGICLFVLSDVARLPVSVVTKESMKYLPAMWITLLIIVVFPEVILWIPRIVFG